MSLNDFAVQLYLTVLAIAAAPILLSWVLRSAAGKATSVPTVDLEAQQAREASEIQQREADEYWYSYDMGMLPESPHD